MKKENAILSDRFRTARWNIIILVFVVLISLVTLAFTRRIFLENGHRMGREITFSYSVEEEHNLEIYKTLITVGAQYIEELSGQGKDEKAIEAWIMDYFQKIIHVTGEKTIDPYAVINNTIVAADSWADNEAYNASETVWYQKVLEAEGEIIFTDVYTDAIYKKPVITIAKECGDSGNVLAFDIFPENFKIHSSSQELPEGSEYYVCDSRGTLLYQETELDMDQEALASHFKVLYEKVRSSEQEQQEVYYYNHDGKRMAVYCREASNGWLSVLVLPHTYLIEDWWRIILLYIFVILFFIAVIAVMWIREYWKNKEFRKINETVYILGNSYYAFYRINIQKETYQMIRGSDYVKEHLKPQGSYHDLLCIFQDIIAEEDYHKFVESFSISGIRKEIEQNINDFGGDFRRLFDGEYKWVNVRMLFEPAQNREEVILCFRVVEEEKQHQLKRMKLLEDAILAANASESSQKQFFSNVSHDMRTPLNVIIGMSELAENNIQNPQKVMDYLEKINYSSKQLLRLLNDILEVSRLEQGIVLDSRKFNIRESVESCAGVFQDQAEEESKIFHFDCSIRHEVVYGDSFRLDQILNNLLSNAFKFTNKGDYITLQLSEIASQEYAKYQIMVEDTGIGMKEEFLEKLFLPYEREERFGARGAGGTGLGMAIVKSIVSLMGGEITVDSTLNKGSIFTVTLPFEPVAVTLDAAAENRETHDFDLSGRKVLLVEDYELNMELATEILEMNGAEVLQAVNGKEALKVFRESEEFAIDAILMDVQMPEMDGCEAARAIRRLPRADAGKTPIIALTANAFAEDIARTSDAGMNAHISKPIDVKILCNTLEKLM